MDFSLVAWFGACPLALHIYFFELLIKKLISVVQLRAPQRGFVLIIWKLCRHLVLGEWLSVLCLEVRVKCCWPDL
jgi:hypothetical protein